MVASGHMDLAVAGTTGHRAGAQRRQHVRRDVRIGTGRDGNRKIGGAEFGLKFVRRAFGDDKAVVDHRYMVGELVGFLQVLRGQQQGDPLRDVAADHVPHDQPAVRVQPGRRLVEEQDPGRRYQAGGQVKTPAHTAGVRLDGPAACLGEAEAVEELRRAAARGPPGKAARRPIITRLDRPLWNSSRAAY